MADPPGNDELATLAVTASESGRCVDVRLSGEIDLSNAAEVAAKMHALLSGHERMVVDLTELGYLDSAGLALVHDLVQQSKRTGCELRIVAAEESNARRVLLLSGIAETISLETSPDGDRSSREEA